MSQVVGIQIPANSALLLGVMYPNWKERISGLDYHKMGRRDLIENAEQAVFDVARVWGSIIKAIPNRNTKNRTLI